jgi:hypothetical protein
MYINEIFELSMVLDHERFHQVFEHVYSKIGCMENGEDEYIDQSLEEKGITVIYRDSQYKKKIKLIVNAGHLLGSGKPDPDKIVRKLNKRIWEYFGFKYKLDDFILSGMRLVTDINVGTHENGQAYLKVFRRIGRVKGFSPVSHEYFEDVNSFCLDGNSNGIEFMMYNLEELYRKQFGEGDIGRKRFKELIRESEGVLRTEVRLAKIRAVREYAGEEDIFRQIINLCEKRQDIFLEIFVKIIPFGDFYKKGKAEEIIRSEIKDTRLRRRMLRLLELIPEKKSLYLAQKAMDCRNIDKIMNAFAEINLSPVTISKRHNVKYLRSLYSYFL